MPNWAEGNLRIRGKRENIMRFLQEEVTAIFTDPSKPYGNDDEERPIIISDNCGGQEVILKRDPDTRSKLYFKGSNRQFIETDGDCEYTVTMSGDSTLLSKDQIAILFGFNAAWKIDDGYFRRKAQQYKVDIRIFAWELGAEWSSISTYYRDGNTDEEFKKYSDWMWESSMPDYGG